MAKSPDLNDVTNILNGASTINDNNAAIESAFENTLSRDGSTPNSMEADLDMNSNDLLNVNEITTNTLTLSGNRVTDIDTYIPQWRSDWATATEYNTLDLVKQNGDSYICLIDHTSNNFSSDLAADRWEVFVEKGDSGAGSGDLLSTNNLSDVSDSVSSRNNLGLEIGVNVQAYDVNLTGTTSNLQTQIDTINTFISNLTGIIMPFAMDTVPSGWLSCDGSAVSRTTYADLFAALGTIYGVGDGSTTFNLPDLRGEFIRGHDDGAGIDPDAASRTDRGDGTTGDNVGTKQSWAVENATGTIGWDVNSTAGSGVFDETGGSPVGGSTSGSSGTRVDFDLSRQVQTSTEARPRNVSMLYCIKT